MLIYIFKSAACMTIFLVFYKLLLEKENMHVFKRFYLLLTLGVSLLIPTLVFTEYVVVEPIPYAETQQHVISDYDYIGVPTALEDDIMDIEPILWTVYFLGFTFFTLKFIKNLGQIIGRIRKNPKQKSASFIQVLLQENFPPHTFFNYIFLNKKKLESNEIPKEVLLHEETHAKQKHSWDVVCIEFLQVIFWFNPLIFLFKKAIKLNHEFLADQAVLTADIDKSTYQNTLLSYLSPDSNNKYQSRMANAINYSSIKKRFTVMKTHTSKKAMFLRSLLLLPLLAVLVLGFSETRLIETEVNSPAITIHLAVKNGNEIWFKGKHITLENLSSSISKVVAEKENKSILNIEISSLAALHSEFQNQLNAELEKVEPTTIHVFSEEYIIPENKFQEEIDVNSSTIRLTTNKMTLVSQIDKATSQQVSQFNKLAKKYNVVPVEKRKIPLADLEVLETIYKKMNAEQKENAQPFPECPQENIRQEGVSKEQFDAYNKIAKSHNLWSDFKLRPRESEIKKLTQIYKLMSPEQRDNAEIFPEYLQTDKPQEGASRELMAEYNTLAKHYNEMPRNKMKIYKKDVDRLEYIYSLMSDKQKADAEPFPDFPEPPTPPKAPEVMKIEASKIPTPPSRSSNLSDEVFAEKVIDETIANQDPYDHGNQYINVSSPPTPPEPPTPLDHVIEMAKIGATFYYEGDEVTSDKAIELMKRNVNLNIDSRGKNSKRPEVRISKSPINH